MTSTARRTSTGRRQSPAPAPTCRTPCSGRRARPWPTPGSATPTATSTPTRSPTRVHLVARWARDAPARLPRPDRLGAPRRAGDDRLPAGWWGSEGNPQVDLAFPPPYPTDHRGVVSTFDVTPAPAPVLVSPDTRRVVTGSGGLRVRFHGRGGPHERVGLPPSDRSHDPVRLVSTRGRRDGVVRVRTAHLRPGRYDVVLTDRDQRPHRGPRSGLGLPAAQSRTPLLRPVGLPRRQPDHGELDPSTGQQPRLDRAVPVSPHLRRPRATISSTATPGPRSRAQRRSTAAATSVRARCRGRCRRASTSRACSSTTGTSRSAPRRGSGSPVRAPGRRSTC